MPRRSTGCEKCRQRKVRCDEAKPHCRRCFEYGIACPGYRPPPEKDLHFVDQTNKVARQSASTKTAKAQLRPTDALRDVGMQAPAKDTEYRWRHQFSGEIASIPGPSSVNNRHLHRVQLMSTFLELYLPKRRDRSMMSHFTYLTALPTIDLSSPLLQISVDTLCLAELGSLYCDERCLQETRSRYVRALPMLANELAKPKHVQLRNDHILAAISVLALCELFDALARGEQGGKGWISHVQGAQTYMRYHCKEVMNSPFGWLLFHNIRHMSLCMNMIKRKASFFAEPGWLKLTQNDAKKDPYVALYDLCIQAPGLLERADDLATTENFDEDFFTVCHDLLQLRAGLAEWMQTFFLNKGGASYRIVDVREMEEFAKLCPNRTYLTVFSFPSVQICSQYQLFWTTSLMLDFTVANLYRCYKVNHSLPDLSLFTTRSSSTIWRDMYVAATNYCRCVPYCCEPETSSIGRIGTFLLRIASSFFDIAGFTRELAWCTDIRRMLEGHSFPQQPWPPGSSSSSSDGSSISSPGSASEPMEPSVPFTVATQLPPSLKPAPIRLEGEYPNTGYTPRMLQPGGGALASSSSATTHTISSNLPRSVLESIPSASVASAAAGAVKSGIYLANTSKLAARFGTARLTVAPDSASASRENSAEPRPQIHGASAMADERVLPAPARFGVVHGYEGAEASMTRTSAAAAAGAVAAAAVEPDVAVAPVDADAIRTGVLARKGINANCNEDFIAPADLQRCFLGSTIALMPDGEPRSGPVGGVCF